MMTNSEYISFIRGKSIVHGDVGFTISKDELSPMLFEFQKDIVRWALAKGRAALFTATGTGKTLMQCEWAKHVHAQTRGSILIVAPLAVCHQTKDMAANIGLDITVCRSQNDVVRGVNITNYEMLHKFNADSFDGIVLDESSILKNYSGATRNMIIDMFGATPYRLACTATPAPNDFMELGNHSEFLGVMTRTEMLSMFFVHDGGDTSQWRLKGHAAQDYWAWIASWAVVLTMPHDLGYEDDGFALPPLNIHHVEIPSALPADGMLFAMPAETLMERKQARASTTSDRVTKCSEIVNAADGPFLVWCGLNRESEMLSRLITDAVEIKGADSTDHKESSMLGFSRGDIRVLVTKPSIAGFGMNWQHCSNVAFVGLSDSFEEYYQAVRRCWRFGQKNQVNVYIITSELEGAVVENIKRKERDAERLVSEMVVHTQYIVSENIKKTTRSDSSYAPTDDILTPEWLNADNSD
jgi:hypothetical protein